MNRIISTRSYRLPDPLRSDEDWARFNHFDLRDLDDLELWQELQKVSMALAWAFKKERDWLLERKAALHNEYRERSRYVDAVR